MGFFQLSSKHRLGEMLVKGRDYFAREAESLGFSGQDPVTVRAGRNPKQLETGRRESRKGGRLAGRSLKHLSPEETAERRRKSEEFLKQPVVIFPAEEKAEPKASEQ